MDGSNRHDTTLTLEKMSIKIQLTSKKATQSSKDTRTLDTLELIDSFVRSSCEESPEPVWV